MMMAGTGTFDDCVSRPVLEDSMMRSSRPILATVLALLGSTPLQADSNGIGGASSNAVATSASTVMLKGTPTTTADNVDVFYGGRWRPYWRGYYHGSAGFAPRPNFAYGPVVYPRFFGYGIVRRPFVGGAYAMPVSGGAAMVSGSNSPPVSDPLAIEPSHSPLVSNYRFDGGHSPANGLLPPQTVEPPIAITSPSTNRVLAAPAARSVGYLAYGETAEANRPTELVKR
jgi:hypothetical protein